MYTGKQLREELDAKKGFLKFDMEDNIIDASVGIEAQTDRFTYHGAIKLFSNPPTLQNSKFVCEGNFTSLDKKTNILARPFYSKNKSGELIYTGYMHVALYEINQEGLNPDLPESGKGVTIKDEGYIQESHVSFINKFNHKNVDKNIFETKPSINDIQQGSAFGDCFLLAAINAILSKKGGADYIMNMIKQDKQHAYVKLFDLDTQTPVICRVSLSEFQNYLENPKTGSIIQHNQPWVHILEKAYAGMGYGPDGKKQYPSFRTIYGKGGHPEQALYVLTGHKPVLHSINRAVFTPWNDDFIMGFARLKWQQYTQDNQRTEQLDKEYINKIENYLSTSQENSLIYEKLFKGKINHLFTWLEFINKIRTKDYNYYKNLVAPAPLSSQQFDTAHYTTIINELKRLNGELLNINQEVKDILNSYANLIAPKSPSANQPLQENETQSVYIAGPTGTGQYTTYQHRIFETIKNALENNCPITCSMGNNQQGDAFYEKDEVQGLYAQHVYTILDYRVEQNSYGINSKYLVLANPWGEKGVSYIDNHGTLKLLLTEKGQFKLDLNDFTRFTSKLQIGTSLQITATKDHLQQNKQCLLENQIKDSSSTCLKYKKLIHDNRGDKNNFTNNPIKLGV